MHAFFKFHMDQSQKMSIDPKQYHNLLTHQNMEKIELAAVKAFEQRLEIPVVMVLDLADPAAKAMACVSGLESRIEASIAEGERRRSCRLDDLALAGTSCPRPAADELS